MKAGTKNLVRADTNQDDGVQVTDVWDNMEDFQAFGQTLVPIMQSMGADPGQPEIQQVHNIIIG